MQKIYLLAATAMPGVHRLLIFFLIERIFTLDALGKFSTDYYVVQFVLIFCVLGLSGLVMIRLPKLAESEYPGFMNTILKSNVLMTFSVLPFIFIAVLFEVIYSWSGAMCLLSAMGLNLIVRHYYFALKQYKVLVVFDMAVILSIFLNLIFIHTIPPIFTITLGYVIPLALVFFQRRTWLVSGKGLLTKNEFSKVAHISLTNFFSGGIIFLLVPVVNYELGVQYAGLLGVLLTITSSAMLLPRALSLYFLPDLSKENNQANNQMKTFEKLNKMTMSVLALTLIVMLLLLLASDYIFPILFALESSWTLYLLVMFIYLSSQLSLPASNILLAKEEVKILTKYNLLIVVFFVSSYFLVSILPLEHIVRIWIVLVILIVGYMIKFYRLKHYLGEIG